MYVLTLAAYVLKIGTIKRKLLWPLCDDMQIGIGKAFHIFKKEPVFIFTRFS